MANAVQEPYTPQSRLLAQLLATRHQPVQSVGQGLADVLGDVGGAYFEKKQLDSDEAKSQDKASKLAQIVAMTMNPQTSQSNIDVQAGNFKQAQPAFPNGAPPNAEAMMADIGRSLDPGAAPAAPMVQAQGAFPQGYTKPVSTQARALAGMQAVGRDAPEMAPQFSVQARSIAESLLPPPKKITYAAAGTQGMDELGNKVGEQVPFAPKDGKQTHLADLISEHKALDANDPLRKIYEQAISKEVAQTGMRVTSDGQGGFEITTGGLEPSMTKPTQAKLEDVVVQSRDALARLNTIKGKFKPEYQQVGARVGNMWGAAKEKLGIPLDEGSQKQLSDFSSYKRDVAENLNSTIKDITGATVSAQEAPRLMQQIPVAGTGILDGDSPTEFQAKVEGLTKSLTAAQARAQYALKNGLNRDQRFAIPLESIPDMIEKKGNQYAEEIQRTNPQAAPEQIKEMVKSRLRQDFGL